MLSACAIMLSRLSTCRRRKVGCVIINRQFRILSSGYNGTPPGMPHCNEIGCKSSEECRALHAEQNAVAFLDGHNRETKYCICTCTPCRSCLKLLATVNVKRIYVIETDHRDSKETLQRAKEFNMEVIKLDEKRIYQTLSKFNVESNF